MNHILCTRVDNYSLCLYFCLCEVILLNRVRPTHSYTPVHE